MLHCHHLSWSVPAYTAVEFKILRRVASRVSLVLHGRSPSSMMASEPEGEGIIAEGAAFLGS